MVLLYRRVNSLARRCCRHEADARPYSLCIATLGWCERCGAGWDVWAGVRGFKVPVTGLGNKASLCHFE